MKIKHLPVVLLAACTLVLVACESTPEIVEDRPQFAAMPEVPAMFEMHAAPGQTIQGLEALIIRSPFVMQQALTAWAQANNRPVPKSGSQAWAEATRDIGLGLVELGKSVTPWAAQAYTVKQWVDVLTNIKPNVTTTTTNNATTTTNTDIGDYSGENSGRVGDYSGGNSGNSGELRVNSDGPTPTTTNTTTTTTDNSSANSESGSQ